MLYDELRRIARSYFRNLRPGFTLCPTELVNEACLHLLQHRKTAWNGPAHFRAIATRKIWQVIVDHLRFRTAAKRGGTRSDEDDAGAVAPDPEIYRLQPADGPLPTNDAPRREPLDAVRIEWRDATVDVLDLAEALDELGAGNPRLREVVMMHWFGGLKYADVARVMQISASSVEKDFHFALAWLNRRLGGKPHES